MTNAVATLPPNTSPLERALATCCAELANVPVPLRDLWSADRCPVNLLPFLAWACSVERWDDTWSDAIKRGAIKASYFIHKHKGTIAAVRRVVESMGYLIRITEWWQKVPAAAPSTFWLDVGVLDTGITEEMYLELARLIDDAKPVSRHLLGLAIKMEVRGTQRTGVSAYLGDEVTVYPYTPSAIVSKGRYGTSSGAHSIDTITVQPLQIVLRNK